MYSTNARSLNRLCGVGLATHPTQSLRGPPCLVYYNFVNDPLLHCQAHIRGSVTLTGHTHGDKRTIEQGDEGLGACLLINGLMSCLDGSLLCQTIFFF